MITDPQRSRPVEPGVISWFKIYCGVLCFIYLCVAACSLICFLFPPKDMDAAGAMITGVIFLVMGGGLFAVCLVPLLFSPRPWLWTYGLVVICLGMTSACFLPVCIPLLIAWLKPEVKAWYGKVE